MGEYKDFILAWLAFSVCAPVFANRMENCGYPYRDTLGWAMISTARAISFGVNGVLIAGALLVGFHWLMTREDELPRQSSKAFEPNVSPPAPRTAQVDEEAIRLRQLKEYLKREAEQEERARQDRQRLKLAKELVATEKARRELEEKQTRSFAAAVEAALEDF